MGPKTRHFRWYPGPGTHLRGGTRDSRLGTLMVRPETRDSTQRWDLGPKTQECKGETRDLRTLLYMGPRPGTQDSGHLSNVGLEIQDPYQDQKQRAHNMNL